MTTELRTVTIAAAPRKELVDAYDALFGAVTEIAEEKSADAYEAAFSDVQELHQENADLRRQVLTLRCGQAELLERQAEFLDVLKETRDLLREVLREPKP